MPETIEETTDTGNPDTKCRTVSRRSFLKGSAALAGLAAAAAAGCTAPPTLTPTITPTAKPTTPAPTAAPTTPAPKPTAAPTAAPTATAVPKPTAAPTPAPTPAPPPSPVFDALQFFDRGQAAVVHAAAGRIIPGMPQDPGAKEAAVVVFIDRALNGYDVALQTDYMIGVAGLETYAQAKYSNGFADITDQQQDDILTNMQTNTDEAKKYFPNPGGFFGRLLTHTRQGMFADPIYGGNRNSVGWKLEGHPGIVFGRDPSQMACNLDYPKEYMGSQEYYSGHPS